MQLRRLGVVLLLIALVASVAMLKPVHETIAGVLDWSKQLISQHQLLGIGLFIVLSAISAIAFFFSSAALVPVATFAWGKPATLLLLWASWLLGAMVSYVIGRSPGRRLARWLIPEGRVVKYEKAVSAESNFRLVLLFQLAVPSEVPGYLLGAVRYHFGKYMAARAVAEAPFAVGAVLLGDTFVHGQYGALVAVGVTGLLISAVALYMLHLRVSRMAEGQS